MELNQPFFTFFSWIPWSTAPTHQNGRDCCKHIGVAAVIGKRCAGVSVSVFRCKKTTPEARVSRRGRPMTFHEWSASRQKRPQPGPRSECQRKQFTRPVRKSCRSHSLQLLHTGACAARSNRKPDLRRNNRTHGRFPSVAGATRRPELKELFVPWNGAACTVKKKAKRKISSAGVTGVEG